MRSRPAHLCSASVLATCEEVFLLGHCPESCPVLLELPVTECAALESFVLHWMVLLTAALSWLASYCLSGVRKACSLSGHCNRPGFPVDGRFPAPAGGTRPLPDLPAAARPREGECRELSGAGELFVTDC